MAFRHKYDLISGFCAFLIAASPNLAHANTSPIRSPDQTIPVSRPLNTPKARIGASLGKQKTEVTNVGDFFVHSQAHARERVPLLAVAAYHAAPNEFPDVDPKLLQWILQHSHDEAKLNDSRSFREKFWPPETQNEKALIQRLFEYFGKYDPALASEAEKAKFQSLMGKLNTADKNFTFNLLSQYGLIDSKGEPTAATNQYLRLERIADCVDRNQDPVARVELSQPVARPLSSFLHGKDLEIAESIAKQYKSIVKGRTYTDLINKPGHRLTQCLRFWMNKLLQ